MMDLVVDSTGMTRCIYHEAFPLLSLGALAIERASSVEPTSGGYWTADLRRVSGPVLGPYLNRSSAIQAEVEWLKLHWL